MQTLTPFLWLENRAEEAAAFYRSVFPDQDGGDVPPPPASGNTWAATIRIVGQTLILFNGGPHHALTPACSLFVQCDTQAEIDRAWDSLVEGGTPLRCGWLTDRFGLTWQIVPRALGRMLQDPDRARADRAMTAMMGMQKLDLAAMQAAYDGA